MTVAMLEIHQGEKESLIDFISRFNNKALEAFMFDLIA